MRTPDDRREGKHLPLEGVRVLTLAVNLPGPVATSRLRDMGAAVFKVEPPGGDPLALMCPGYHAELSAGPVWERLRRELGIEGDGRRGLERVSRTRTTGQWEERASERDLPLAAVR